MLKVKVQYFVNGNKKVGALGGGGGSGGGLRVAPPQGKKFFNLKSLKVLFQAGFFSKFQGRVSINFSNYFQIVSVNL